MVQYYRQLGWHLAANGYYPMPCFKSRKNPPVRRWKHPERHCYRHPNGAVEFAEPGDQNHRGEYATHLYRIMLADGQYWDCNTGIVLGIAPHYEFAIDSDIGDPVAAADFKSRLLNHLPLLAEGIWRRSSGCRWAVIARTDKPIKKWSSPKFGEHGLDILGERDFIILSGEHKNGKDLYTHSAIPPAGELPRVPSAFIPGIRRIFLQVLEDHGLKIPEQAKTVPQAIAELKDQREFADTAKNVMEKLAAYRDKPPIHGRLQRKLLIELDLDPTMQLSMNYWSWTVREFIERVGRLPMQVLDDRDFWLYLIYGMKDMNASPICELVCDATCSLSVRYDKKDQQSTWAKANRNSTSAVTMGTVKKICNEFRSIVPLSGFKFIQEFVRFEEGAEISVAELYANYQAWCSAHGKFPISKIQFGKNLQCKIPQICKFQMPKKRARGWRNIILVNKVVLPASPAGLITITNQPKTKEQL